MALRRTPTEILVRDATSNEKVPPSGQQMRQIADMSYNFQDYVEVMRVLWERLEDDGKNWRHVYKVR
jgi:epsin